MKRFNVRIGMIIVSAFVAGLLVSGVFADRDRGTPGCGLMLSQSALAQNGISPSIPDVVERVVPAVVNISSKKVVKTSDSRGFPFNDPFFRRFFPEDFFRQYNQERVQRNLGSGVIISEEGFILTNNHLVEKADEVLVVLPDNREFDAEIVGTDPMTDVAVLKIDAEGLPTVMSGDAEKLRLGETVLAIGYPYGVGQTVTMGIVSALGRSELRLAEYEYFIQTDAAINFGNSGGALINTNGELVGINTAILSPSGTGSVGIGFAIPINLASKVMGNIIEHGRVIRGYLGVYLDNITPQMAEGFDLEEAKGVIITDVVEDSPAERGGLERYDVVLTFAGRDVINMAEFRQMVSLTMPGEEVKMEIIRDGKRKSVSVELGEHPRSRQAATRRDQEDIASPLLLGVGLETLTDYYRERLDIPSDVSGVIVTDVERNSSAAEAGLLQGDVIVEVDRREISDLDDFNRVVERLDKSVVGLTVYREGRHRFVLIKD